MTYTVEDLAAIASNSPVIKKVNLNLLSLYNKDPSLSFLDRYSFEFYQDSIMVWNVWEYQSVHPRYEDISLKEAKEHLAKQLNIISHTLGITKKDTTPSKRWEDILI